MAPCFQAKIPGEILQNVQSYFWTRPKVPITIISFKDLALSREERDDGG